MFDTGHFQFGGYKTPLLLIYLIGILWNVCYFKLCFGQGYLGLFV